MHQKNNDPQTVGAITGGTQLIDEKSHYKEIKKNLPSIFIGKKLVQLRDDMQIMAYQNLPSHEIRREVSQIINNLQKEASYGE